MATPSPTIFESASFKRLLVRRVAEEALAATENHREHHQTQLVHEIVLDERLHEPGAAGDEDDAVHVVLQLRDLFDDDPR